MNFQIKDYGYGTCVEIWDGDKYEDALFHINGSHLSTWNKGHNVEMDLPNWLADGIRELVKNKIEQENDRGA